MMIDDFVTYVFFNSIEVISWWWLGDFVWVEALQPKQPISVMSSRSVYLTTHFSGQT